jgi:alkylhydroperoxidase family enzyme
MPRIQPVAYADQSIEIREILATRPSYNIYNTLAHAPTLLPGFIQLASAILTKTVIDPKLRELVILRVGGHCQSAYELHQHRRLALRLGVTPEQIERCLTLVPRAFGTSEEDTLMAFTDAVVTKIKVPDDLFHATRQWLSDREITELLLTIGTYMMVSRFLENSGVEIETTPVDIDTKAFYPQSTQTG